MNKFIKYSITIITFSCLCGSYFYRDFIFINANSQIKYLNEVEELRHYANTTPDYVFNENHVKNWTHSKMENKFMGWNTSGLIAYKWRMTFVFTFLFMGLTALGFALIKWHKILVYVTLFYLLLFGFAFGINYFSYSVSRDIIGLLHSPLPFLMFLAIGYINKLIRQNEK